ncbi:hypothetical protein L1987_54075 [Smallanthus sonchifolius]|uniref:Uncharacterized protein n=1 Tax=Smallanthus sonchifolius TaxID=185202 RepID=A0ACB9E6T3_9ASTR|nr:hypothetical protein L1987_54075 [Smallanthus sonchifolius]
MAGLPRSDVSFRRSGSSGLVWEDKLLSEGIRPKDQVERIEAQRPKPKPCRTIEAAPAIDPPSPKVSGCGDMCPMFGKNTNSSTQKPKKRGNRKLQELDYEIRCLEELKEAMQMAMEGGKDAQAIR